MTSILPLSSPIGVAPGSLLGVRGSYLPVQRNLTRQPDGSSGFRQIDRHLTLDRPAQLIDYAASPEPELGPGIVAAHSGVLYHWLFDYAPGGQQVPVLARSDDGAELWAFTGGVDLDRVPWVGAGVNDGVFWASSDGWLIERNTSDGSEATVLRQLDNQGPSFDGATLRTSIVEFRDLTNPFGIGGAGAFGDPPWDSTIRFSRTILLQQVMSRAGDAWRGLIYLRRGLPDQPTVTTVAMGTFEGSDTNDRSEVVVPDGVRPDLLAFSRELGLLAIAGEPIDASADPERTAIIVFDDQGERFRIHESAAVGPPLWMTFDDAGRLWVMRSSATDSLRLPGDQFAAAHGAGRLRPPQDNPPAQRVSSFVVDGEGAPVIHWDDDQSGLDVRPSFLVELSDAVTRFGGAISWAPHDLEQHRLQMPPARLAF